MDVELLAHRGLWRRPEEQNTLPALTGALHRGLGVETDVRDCAGRLAISHDPADVSSPDFGELCHCYAQMKSTATLAVNIKSDGLAGPLHQTLANFGITNYFVFDMSVPDALQYAKRSVPLYSRHSDAETRVTLYDHCVGVWLDAFWSDWFDASHVKEHFRSGKDVCVVSPELHGRRHEGVWQWLRQVQTPPGRRLLLCTDYADRFA
jgi:glycerophosphoryl diester phosphodiesterase